MSGWDPAFPYQPLELEQAPKPDRLVQGPGLTKRELFAAMVLQGMWAGGASTGADGTEIPKLYAKCAVTAADALLVELGCEPKEKKS